MAGRCGRGAYQREQPAIQSRPNCNPAQTGSNDPQPDTAPDNPYSSHRKTSHWPLKNPASKGRDPHAQDRQGTKSAPPRDDPPAMSSNAQRCPDGGPIGRPEYAYPAAPNTDHPAQHGAHDAQHLFSGCDTPLRFWPPSPPAGHRNGPPDILWLHG